MASKKTLRVGSWEFVIRAVEVDNCYAAITKALSEHAASNRAKIYTPTPCYRGSYQRPLLVAYLSSIQGQIETVNPPETRYLAHFTPWGVVKIRDWVGLEAVLQLAPAMVSNAFGQTDFFDFLIKADTGVFPYKVFTLFEKIHYFEFARINTDRDYLKTPTFILARNGKIVHFKGLFYEDEKINELKRASDDLGKLYSPNIEVEFRESNDKVITWINKEANKLGVRFTKNYFYEGVRAYLRLLEEAHNILVDEVIELLRSVK